MLLANKAVIGLTVIHYFLGVFILIKSVYANVIDTHGVVFRLDVPGG